MPETDRSTDAERIAELERELGARDKTLAVLVERVKERQRSRDSAFAWLEQNAALQQVVARKTVELEEQNRRLERAYADLRSAQEELLQAQKLESVGRLASGIAHEINTPVQFVSDSVTFARDGAKDLFVLIGELRGLLAAVARGRSAEDAEAAATQAADAADLPYLVDQLPKALDRAIDGLGRVSEIVRSMKGFAHPDRKEMAEVDLNRAVRSALVVAKNEYKYVADATAELGEIPPVTCYGGEVNQVLLNLVVNAAHAIGDAVQGSKQRGRITVSTRRDGSDVVVSVSDTGTGIPESIRQSIFDPFFTTKEVGRGTGQGLAIARRVIQLKHGGALTFETEVGKGTTFHVRLPIAGPHVPTPTEPA